MKKFGLIGHPLDHSKSPKLHQLIADALKRKISYTLFDVKSIEQVKNLLDDLKKGHYNGFNITIPYKEAVLPFLDQLTPKAALIGAVNTVYLKDGRFIGDNTDYDGFKYLLENFKVKKDFKDIIILGSGGAAKACFTVCKDLGYMPVIVSRNPQRKHDFHKVIGYREIKNTPYDLIIQTTPIGMYPKIDQMPLDKNLVKDKLVIDLIYNPKETQIMKHSQYAVGGIDMLIIQALKAQNIWFNKDIDLNVDALNQMRKDLYE